VPFELRNRHVHFIWTRIPFILNQIPSRIPRVERTSMKIYVACDVCGHRYVLPGDRSGRNAKCKSCGVSFEVSPENFYDPDTSEMDEEDEDDDQDSSLNPVWDLAKKVGHAMAGLVTLSMLVWMGSLLFRSPREAVAQNGQSPTRPSGYPSTPRVNEAASRAVPLRLQSVEPQMRTIPPPQVRPAPPPSKLPAADTPTISDGSIGWPKENETPSAPSVTNPRMRPPRK
jgi:hypothetical protein